MGEGLSKMEKMVVEVIDGEERWWRRRVKQAERGGGGYEDEREVGCRAAE